MTGTPNHSAPQQALDHMTRVFGSATLRTLALTPLVLVIWTLIGTTVVAACLDRNPPFDIEASVGVLSAVVVWPVLLRMVSLLAGERIGFVNLSPKDSLSTLEAAIRRKLLGFVLLVLPVVGAIGGAAFARGGITQHLWGVLLGAMGLPIVLGIPLYFSTMVAVKIGSRFRVRPVLDRV